MTVILAVAPDTVVVVVTSEDWICSATATPLLTDASSVATLVDWCRLARPACVGLMIIITTTAVEDAPVEADQQVEHKQCERIHGVMQCLRSPEIFSEV